MVEQLVFAFEDVPICPGEPLRFKQYETEYHFINAAGFRTIPPPDGAYVAVLARPMVLGVYMPELEGLFCCVEGTCGIYPTDELFKNRTGIHKWSLRKLWNDDIVVIRKLNGLEL